jgi:3-methyl-2-oxobutanoate hydroxymethyltransferase
MRLTIRDIQKMKDAGEPFAMLTAYDTTSAHLSDAAGVPMLLVGDSLGMVIQGHDTTIPVTLDHIIYHSQIVVRATEHALIVGDMPFMSYKVSEEQALTNAARLMQESGVGAVKLEGGEYIAPTIARLVQVGIPVMAHIGLTPQSVRALGGWRVQGKETHSAEQIIHDAQAVEQAGAFAVVLELMGAQLAEIITAKLEIPTIGIGAGPHCDGQVQVFQDILGLYPSFGPRHAKKYADVSAIILQAIGQFVGEVKSHQFPTTEQSFAMKEEVVAAIRNDGV